ncbi:poly(A)-specific ribonuclease PNLDC1 isoform X5 [Alligator mississippiensis]|uniref:poly(A)-specific ribonuclease PNLDC1 isoform X5 n=1 Tax=Alligator mississippiensis TaxID=8496 RepID=UPI00287728A9|nr:poly(A)-specific ribonuclease PNLDC1 isoform X5 [Alligator mississippiensis]
MPPKSCLSAACSKSSLAPSIPSSNFCCFILPLSSFVRMLHEPRQGLVKEVAFEAGLRSNALLVLLCLDMEYTGLHSAFPEGKQLSLFDSPAERYLKARRSVQQFTVCQLGLSIFSSEKSNKYVAHSYNFFLFPTMFGTLDSEFSFQASSIQFLTHYGFDYNKFLKDGIPYVNEVQEKKLQQELFAGNWKVHSTLDKDRLKVVIDEVTRWVSSAEEGESMVVSDLTGFQIFEVQLILRRALPDIWTKPSGDNEVIVEKMNPRHRWHLENTSCDFCRKELILLSARGFTSLFQTLVKAKKPLVGHNMLMDLLHLHDKFYRPLPESYEEFKTNIHSLFPVIIDTKNVTKTIWKELKFPRACNLLETYEILCSDTKKNGPSFSQYLNVLAKYLNQVNLIRAAVSKINFSGADVPSRHLPLLIASVRGWPGVNEEQIYQELKGLCRFDVRQLTKNQFLLLSNNFKNVRVVLEDYKDYPNLRISFYHYWRHSPQVNCLLQFWGFYQRICDFFMRKPESLMIIHSDLPSAVYLQLTNVLPIK